eukprot:g12443.t1
MASAVDRAQIRLQEAMEQGNQASLGQAIDASKGVNGLKQLRRSAKARLKQLSADQNRSMIGSGSSHMQQPAEAPLTWRTSEQGGRYRAVAHLPTSIIGWVIGHKGCNARMLKQQTGTELWVDVPGQCVIIESRAAQEVEGGMEAVNDFVKTAPTFIAKVQSGSGEGITQTVQCPVHLLPSIQRLSRKIQAESGANCVFANCKMSTFCVTGDRKTVDIAVGMLKRLIAEGNIDNSTGASGNGNAQQQQQQQQQQHHQHHQHHQQQQHQHQRQHSSGSGNGMNGNNNGMNGGDRRAAVGAGEMGQRLGRVESDMSRSDPNSSPPTAPCSPEVVQAANAWGNGAPSHLQAWNTPQHYQHPQQQHHHHFHHQQQQQQQQQHQRQPDQPPCSSTPTLAPTAAAAGATPTLGGMGIAGGGPLPPPPTELAPSHYGNPASAPATPGGTVAPFHASNTTGGGGGGPSSDLSFFSFGVGGVTNNSAASPPAPGIAPSTRASTAPTPGVNGGLSGGGGGGLGLPGLGFLEESAGAGGRLGYEQEFVDDERRTSSCESGEYGGGEAHGFPNHSRQPGSVGSLGVGSSSGGAGAAGMGGGGGGGGGGGTGCPLEGTIDELLEELGLEKYLHIFKDAEVDLATLCIMQEQDYRELGILKGPRVKIMHHIGSR